MAFVGDGLYVGDGGAALEALYQHLKIESDDPMKMYLKKPPSVPVFKKKNNSPSSL